MRLIDADAIITKLEKDIDKRNLHWLSFFIDEIEEIPTIEAEPVKHGKWIPCKTADYVFCCSACGYGYTDNRLSYCYDCGARMEE